MKIYEIGTPDHYDEDTDGCDCTIWIASKYPINKIGTDERVYVREIASDPIKVKGFLEKGGVDFII